MWPERNLNRLQRKVLAVILTIVVLPMLVAALLASEWVSSGFEDRLQRWIEDAAHTTQVWLQAYQNDAIMLGDIVADDEEFIYRLDRNDADPIGQPVARIAQELGVNFIQVYTPKKQLVYSSTPVTLRTSWETGQTEAVLKVVEKKKTQLAAVGITPVPRKGEPRYYLVFGSLINQAFISELTNLTGMKTRLYYQEGNSYFDVFTVPGKSIPLSHLSKEVLKRLQRDKKPYYNANRY